MKRLNIKQLELTDEDEATMDRADVKDTTKEQVATAKAISTSQVQDPMTLLKQLGELKAAGILTEEEFEVKKAERLSRM